MATPADGEPLCVRFDEGAKVCGSCKTELPRHAFHRARNRRDGLYPACKLCRCGVGRLVVVVRRHPCEHCGRHFRPRQNKGVFVRHCSRECMFASGTHDGNNNSRWADVPDYKCAHLRVNRQRTKPKQCEWCGAERRLEWALVHERCPEPLWGSDNPGDPPSPYSANPDDYDAVCKPCHKTYDARHRRAHAPMVVVLHPSRPMPRHLSRIADHTIVADVTTVEGRAAAMDALRDLEPSYAR